MTHPATTQLGAYQLVRRLGAGAMGTVYLARQESLAREVAIKVLPLDEAGSTEALARFHREAEIVKPTGANRAWYVRVARPRSTLASTTSSPAGWESRS